VTPPKKQRSTGWTLVLILLGLYLLLKAQGWWYGFQVERLHRERAQLRPVLSEIVQAEQLRVTETAYAQAFQQIRQMALEGSAVLQDLSRHVPPSVTIEQVDAASGLTIQGSVIPGIRTSEAALLPWAEKMRAARTAVRVRKLLPDSRTPGLWHFELKVEEPKDA